MPNFTVRRMVDVFAVSEAVVEAATAEDAAIQAREHEEKYTWSEEDTQTFDAREFVTLDDNGHAIETTARFRFRSHSSPVD